MLRGYRFLVAAACGLALAGTLGTGAFFGSLYSPGHKQYQAIAGEQRGQGDYTGPSQSLPDISGLPGPVERAIANPRPPGGQDHEKRDLAAQEASALWAFWMVCGTFASVLITAVGTIFLYKQIVLTREAVEDTGKATLAMERQNELAENTAKRQLRAYCNVAEYGVTGVGVNYEPVFIVTAFNTGQTPAKTVKFDSEAALVLNDGQHPDYYPNVAAFASITVGSGRPISSRAALNRKLTQADWDDLVSGKLILQVRAYGEYFDIFGDPQWFRSIAYVVGLPNETIIKPLIGADTST